MEKETALDMVKEIEAGKKTYTRTVHQELMKESIGLLLDVKRFDKGVVLPREIVQFLTYYIHKQEPFASAPVAMQLFDNPYILGKQVSRETKRDIQTIHPKISQLVDAVHGEVDVLKSLHIIQETINHYLDTAYNPTQKRKKDQLHFQFVNLSFVSESEGADDIMGIFLAKDSVEWHSLQSDGFVLTDDATNHWLDNLNNRSAAVKSLDEDHKRKTEQAGGFVGFVVDMLFDIII